MFVDAVGVEVLVVLLSWVVGMALLEVEEVVLMFRRLDKGRILGLWRVLVELPLLLLL